MGLKILTVDDSKTIRMVVKKAFKQYDCELFEGENGIEGLAVASKEKPDLIVLDITMPLMDGKEMLAKLKAEEDLKNIPVIMLTAESGQDNVMEIVKMGVRDYMVKPFKGPQLIERVTKLVKLEPKKEDVETSGSGGTNGAGKYFKIDGDVQFLMFPAASNGQAVAKISTILKNDVPAAAEAGQKKLIMDLSEMEKINISIVKLVISAMDVCQKTKTNIRIIGNSKIGDELKGFEETSQIPVYGSEEEARSSFN